MILARNIILHIGVPKTGSTTIQKFLTENAERLPAMGYAYLKSLGQPNNTGLVLHCRDFKARAKTGRDLRYRHGIRSEADLAGYRSKLEAELAAEIAALPENVETVIMSCELCARLEENEIQRLKALIAPFASSIKVLLYLRGQDEIIRSSYTTTLRVGYSGSFARWIEDEMEKDMFQFDRLLGKWARVFGENALIVRLFRRDMFKNGDFVQDFCNAAGFKDISNLSAIGPSNQSLYTSIQGFLREFNVNFPARPSDGALRSLKLFMSVLNRDTYAGRGETLDSTTANEILHYFAKNNEIVRKKWFPEIAPLFPLKADSEAAPRDEQAELKIVWQLMYETIVECIRMEELMEKRKRVTIRRAS